MSQPLQKEETGYPIVTRARSVAYHINYEGVKQKARRTVTYRI